MENKGGRDAATRFFSTADTFRLLAALDDLWRDAVRPRERLHVMQVGVTLYALTPMAAIAPDLFGWSPDQTENARRLRLSSALDRLNQKYGSETVSIGIVPTGLPGYMGAKIAFNRIPERADFAG